MRRHLRGRLGIAAVVGLSVIAGGAEPADDSPVAKANRALAARGLKRVDDRYILATEEQIGARLGQLQTLVEANQEALRGRTLRSIINAQSQSVLADLQAWRLAITAIEGSRNFPGVAPGAIPPNPLLPSYPGVPDIADLNQQQITNMFNVVAGIESQNAFEAAEALARQDDFDRARARLRRAIEFLAPAYRAINADASIPAALGTLTRAENKAITLGPLADYAGWLDRLERGMDLTRVLTTIKGTGAPDYGVAANLAQGARLNLRMALGRYREWKQQSESSPAASDPLRGKALREEVGRRRDRFVHSVTLLRKAYDAYRPPPFVRNETVESIPEPAEPGRIRALVERRRAEIRATFVKDAERALRTARVPLEKSEGALWAAVTVNGQERRMRVDPEATQVLVSEAFARAVGISFDPGTRRGRIDSIQIGPFTAEGVTCRVLSGDDVAAPPILGAPVLGEFSCELAEEGAPPALFLTRVNVDPIAPRPRPAAAPPAKVGRSTP